MSNLIKKIVSIEWLDAIGPTQDWEFIEDYKQLEPVICTSIGFLSDINKEYVTIVQSIGKNNNKIDIIVGRMTIPIKSIISVKELHTGAHRGTVDALSTL